MFQKPSKDIKNFYKLLKLVSMVWLLLLYLGGNTQIGFLHQLVHPDELASTHSVVQEKSACHRAQFHGEKSGCNHEFHLAKASSCNLSHTLTHSDQIFLGFDRSIVVGMFSMEIPVFFLDVTNTDSTGIFLRGPPRSKASLII